jgi:hypothetical protein
LSLPRIKIVFAIASLRVINRETIRDHWNPKKQKTLCFISVQKKGFLIFWPGLNVGDMTTTPIGVFLPDFAMFKYLSSLERSARDDGGLSGDVQPQRNDRLLYSCCAHVF